MILLDNDYDRYGKTILPTTETSCSFLIYQVRRHPFCFITLAWLSFRFWRARVEVEYQNSWTNNSKPQENMDNALTKEEQFR